VRSHPTGNNGRTSGVAVISCDEPPVKFAGQTEVGVPQGKKARIHMWTIFVANTYQAFSCIVCACFRLACLKRTVRNAASTASLISLMPRKPNKELTACHH
jgi:hypothetical protein